MSLISEKDKKQFEQKLALSDLKDAQSAVRMGLVDTVATYVNKGYWLQFSRISNTDFSVNFSAFMESFSDSYSSNFQQDAAFGRTDPLPYYQNTQRSISMSWAIVAQNEAAAAKNLNDVNSLVQMLYPSYTKHGSQNTYSGAPIIGLRYINLAQSPTSIAGEDLLAGTISSFNFTPDLEFGVFEIENTGILPKIIRLNCTFNPIHDQTLGFDSNGRTISGVQGEDFPYTNIVGSTPGTPSKSEYTQEYLAKFKDGTLGERDMEPDTAYSVVLKSREDSILGSLEGSPSPWEKLFGG